MDEILRIMLPSRNQNFSCLVMRIDIEGSEAVKTFCKYSRDNVLQSPINSESAAAASETFRFIFILRFSLCRSSSMECMLQASALSLIHGQKLLSAGLDSADNENDRTDHCYGSTDEDVFTE